MSLKAKIEAVIYAAEEPVTLAQLAGIFAEEYPRRGRAEDPSIVSLIEEGFLQAESLLAGDSDHLAELALLSSQENAGKKRQLPILQLWGPRLSASPDCGTGRFASRSRQSSTN